MFSTLDVDLNDAELDTEIRLLADLMVVACETAGTLDLATIDATLGLWSFQEPSLPQQRRVA